MSRSPIEILIVGAGIAGASLAAELAATHRVMLLEREPAPGYHSTGRSAALFSAIYGNRPVRELSRASRSFFFAPPEGFSPYPLVRRRGSLLVATADQRSALEEFLALEDMAGSVRRLDPEEAMSLAPLLRPEAVAAGGAYEADSSDVDVHALHQGYLRLSRQLGGILVNEAEVTALGRDGEGWSLRTTAGDFRAHVIVNAAGAWADTIARLAGLAPMRIQACRRTAALIELPAGVNPDHWPMVIAIDEAWYCKPDAGLLLISPADETPVEPCDAQPDEIDVALAVDRVERAMRLDIKRVRRTWAGLRSFAPDRSPVIGFDPAAPGFFWLAGQGGYGIQTAPAAAALAAALIRGNSLPQALGGFDPASVSPERFARASREVMP